MINRFVHYFKKKHAVKKNVLQAFHKTVSLCYFKNVDMK